MLGSAPLWLWLVFHLLLFVLFALDASLNRSVRRPHPVAPTLTPSVPSSHYLAYWMTTIWAAAALLFSLLVGHVWNPHLAAEYLAAYGIEASLSLDNLFVFLLLFRAFALNQQQQRRVLFWGILGAILLRVVMIAAGLTLVKFFTWINYAFGILLLLAALRLLWKHLHPSHQQPYWIAWLGRALPLSLRPSCDSFFLREEGHWRGTHLLLALLAIEITDLFFAVDSIPAVLAVSHHPFVVYTSNIFAVIGMRSLYFVVAWAMEQFSLLPYGLAAILLFVAAKMLLSRVIEIPISLSLGVLATILALTILLSLRKRRTPDASQ